MKIANLKTMLENEIGVEYECQGHKWINEQLNCGCISAICADINPLKEDSDFVSKSFTKINTLQSLLRESMTSADEEIKQKFDSFLKEVEETRIQLKDFVARKRKEYDLPNNSDFNSENYYIKIKQGTDCKNNF